MTATEENNRNANAIALDPRVEEANRILLGADGKPANPLAVAGLYRAALDQGATAGGERLAVLAAPRGR